MYAEQLHTPHPEHNTTGLEPRPLLASLDIAAFKLDLDDARRRGPASYQQAVMEALPVIQTGVRKALWYRDEGALNRDAQTTMFDTLTETQDTACFGYAVVTSECLSLAGIRHWLAYGGEHALITLPFTTKEGGRQLYLVDPFKPDLNDNITGALMGNTVKGMADQMQGSMKRGAALLNVSLLAIRKGYSSTASFYQEFGYMTHRKHNLYGDIRVPGEDTRRPDTVVLSTFSPHVGATVLQHTASYRSAAQWHQGVTASGALHSMRGLYPQLDARAPSHRYIVDVVTDLCKQQSFARATRAVADYCASFAQSKDSRLTELEGDLFGLVAQHKRDQNLLETAVASYRTAAKQSRQVWAISGLLKKIDRMRAVFGSRDPGEALAETS
jgi:hypothetical protein